MPSLPDADAQHPHPPVPPSSSPIYNAVTQIFTFEGAGRLTEDDYQQIYYHFDDYAADIILANGMLCGTITYIIFSVLKLQNAKRDVCIA